MFRSVYRKYTRYHREKNKRSLQYGERENYACKIKTLHEKFNILKSESDKLVTQISTPNTQIGNKAINIRNGVNNEKITENINCDVDGLERKIH